MKFETFISLILVDKKVVSTEDELNITDPPYKIELETGILINPFILPKKYRGKLSLLFMKMRRGVYPAPRLWFLREPYPAGYYSPAHSWRGFRDSDRGRRLSAFAGIRPTSRQYPFRQSTRRCDMR